MMDIEELRWEVRAAWASVAAPPAEEMVDFMREWGRPAAEAFVGVSPMGVDLGSEGFLGCTPLLIIPTHVAAAYLGAFILSFLEGLSYQENIGLFHDLLTRAHLLNCVTQPQFWRRVVPALSSYQQKVFIEFCELVIAERGMLNLDENQVEFIAKMAKALRAEG